MEFRTVTPETLVSVAVSRWNTAREKELAAQAEYEAQERATMAERASKVMEDVLELPRGTLEPAAWIVELEDERARARTSFAGLEWEWRPSSHPAVYLTKRCACGHETPAYVDSLARLGAMLEWEVQHHPTHLLAKAVAALGLTAEPEEKAIDRIRAPEELVLEGLRAMIRNGGVE